MNTVQMNSDPGITIAELWRLNKALTKRLHLKWSLLFGEELGKDNFYYLFIKNFYFILEHSWLTTLFQVYSEVIQLDIKNIRDA